MRSIVKKVVKSILKAKKNEPVYEALERQVINIKKKLQKKSISVKEIENKLRSIGITNGDVIMLHSSWRQFYKYKGTPDDFIDTILRLIGEEGTLLMPCYGDDRTYFDVSNTLTVAGAVPEVFRKRNDVVRSSCTHFSIVAKGLLANELTKDHINSEYGFDKHSPYYKFSQTERQ